MTASGLVVLNDGSATRFDGRGTTSIDLAIVSAGLGKLSSWQVLDDNWGSDHFPIVTTLHNFCNKGPRPQINQPPNFNYTKADWGQFRTLCEELPLEDLDWYDPDTLNYQLSEMSLSIARRCIPSSSGRPPKRQLVPWWNPDCSKAVQGRKKH